MSPGISIGTALKRMNWVMNLAILVLLVVGVLFVYSATSAREEQTIRWLWRKQLFWALAGLGVYLGMAVFDYRRLRDQAPLIYGFALVLLVVVLVMGTRIYGARRWLMFFGMGIQPSELAKVAVILALAAWLSRHKTGNDRLSVFLGAVALAAIPAARILVEPDLGTTLILGPILLALLYTGGGSMKALTVVLALGFLAVTFILGAILLPERWGWSPERQEKIQTLTGLSTYQRDRVRVFLNPDSDPMGAGWNKRQSEIAVGSGGLLGKGFRKGTQNMLGFLPKTVAPTDFIFSVITEEMGFMGSALILGSFAMLILSGLQAAMAGNDRFGRLICVGVIAMLFSHVVVNVSMTIGLMPVTGLPLPLISYGGTFMVSILAALGMTQSVYIRRAGI
jgi:rod shape determining protein RodA